MTLPASGARRRAACVGSGRSSRRQDGAAGRERLLCAGTWNSGRNHAPQVQRANRWVGSAAPLPGKGCQDGGPGRPGSTSREHLQEPPGTAGASPLPVSPGGWGAARRPGLGRERLPAGIFRRAGIAQGLSHARGISRGHEGAFGGTTRGNQECPAGASARGYRGRCQRPCQHADRLPEELCAPNRDHSFREGGIAPPAGRTLEGAAQALAAVVARQR